MVQDARENAMGWIVGAKLLAGQSLFSDVSWIDLGDPGRTIPMIPLQAERCFDAGYFKATHLWGTVVSGCYSNCNRVKLSDVGIWSIRVHIPTVSPNDCWQKTGMIMVMIADSISDSWIEMGQEWFFSESGQK